jgi:hippurate hydrolase
MEMERQLADNIFRLLKFGVFRGGTVRNALAPHVRLEGSLRAFQDDVFEGLREGLYAIGREVAQTYGAQVTLGFSTGYPAVMNPRFLAEKVMDIAPYRLLEEPSMTSEDFSFYQRKVPAMFFFLGLGDTPALHTAEFDFDETVLLKGVEFFEKIAEAYV